MTAENPDNSTSHTKLWSKARQGGPRQSLTEPQERQAAETRDERTPFEHDYDRLLFSTPVRRMADKTQVFPLQEQISIRTRLTHSHEVSNLARSIGNRLIRTRRDVFGTVENGEAAPTILAAIGLAHDLGNPPFGHQGEAAIRQWFKKHLKEVFDDGSVSGDLQEDFINFEGNAQTLRLISCLQISSGGFGLDLTAGTLGSLMKYTVPASRAGKRASISSPAGKKPGYFSSDQKLVDWIRLETGLQEGQRHPLTWLMEACDDIAYSVLDIEDSIKKAIISPEDVIAFLRRKCRRSSQVIGQLDLDFCRADKDSNPMRSREIKTSYFRARLFEFLITGCANSFLAARDRIFLQEHAKALLDDGSPEAEMYCYLKLYAKTFAYNHSAVLRAELQGAAALESLMDSLWKAITDRENRTDSMSRQKTALSTYVYGLISENYKCEFQQKASSGILPIRYCEAQLLTDMVSGMSDTFVLRMHNDIRAVLNG